MLKVDAERCLPIGEAQIASGMPGQDFLIFVPAGGGFNLIDKRLVV